MLDNWQRLERIIKWTGLSINSFALAIGLKRSENLYQIKKGNNRISRDLVDLITVKYPTISKGWLMTGEGEMFIEQSAAASKFSIPYYGVDASMAVGLDSEHLPEPNFYLNIPFFSGADMAALTFKRSMHPEIPAGATVVLKKTDVANVVPGEAYLIVSENFSDIRKIRFSSDPQELILIPSNLEEFDQMTIMRSAVEKLYIVQGVIVDRKI